MRDDIVRAHVVLPPKADDRFLPCGQTGRDNIMAHENVGAQASDFALGPWPSQGFGFGR